MQVRDSILVIGRCWRLSWIEQPLSSSMVRVWKWFWIRYRRLLKFVLFVIIDILKHCLNIHSYVVHYRENRSALDVDIKLRNAGKHGRKAAALVHGHDGEKREREKSTLVPLAELDPLAGQFHLFLTSGKTARNKHYAFDYFIIMAIICQVGKLPLFQGQHRS